MNSKTNEYNCSSDFVTKILPELRIYNTFLMETNHTWWQKHSVKVFFMVSAILGYILFSINWSFVDEARNRMYDEMAVTVVDFGDFIPLSKVRAGASFVEIDEVFGNQYIKDKSKEFNPDRDIVDPRIGTAVNPVISNATAPVDLVPYVTPEYTPRARAAGIEGALILELVISDTGDVLRAKVVGKKLGHGLDEAAVQCYERKRFKPSINSDGKHITVKIYQPVRFRLF